jgi:hypothetical protein
MLSLSILLSVKGVEQAWILRWRRFGMRRIWVYWLVIIVVILYFSIGIVKAAEYQSHVFTGSDTYKTYKTPGREFQKEFNK